MCRMEPILDSSAHILRQARSVRLAINEPTSPVFRTAHLAAKYGEPLPEDGLQQLLADDKDVIGCIERWWNETSVQHTEDVIDTYYGT